MLLRDKMRVFEDKLFIGKAWTYNIGACLSEKYYFHSYTVAFVLILLFIKESKFFLFRKKYF